MWDELDEPLGFVAGSASALAVRDKRPMRGAATVAAILAIAVGLVMLPRPDFPVKGQPFAVAKVEILPAPPKLVAPDATASVVLIPATPAASAAQVETPTGSRLRVGPAAHRSRLSSMWRRRWAPSSRRPLTAAFQTSRNMAFYLTSRSMEHAALNRIIEPARQRGSAVGVVSVSPASIARLERWTNGLDSKGVALVPFSALISGASRPSAQLNGSVSP